MNYHDKPEMSQSKMKVLIESPRMYYKQYILGERVDNATKSKQFGTCLDSALTEPEVYATFTIKDCKETSVANCTTKAWNIQIKQILADLQKYRFNDDFFDGMTFKEIELFCTKQQETYYTYNDIEWRMKTDLEYINGDSSVFIDIKSTCATTYEQFVKQFFQYKYYLQAASYTKGLQIKHNIASNIPAYYIGLSTITGEIFVIRCSEELIQLGLIEIDYGCRLYHHMMKTQEWSNNADVKVLHAPAWIQNKILTLGETLWPQN